MFNEDLDYETKASIDAFLQLSLKNQEKTMFPIDVGAATSILWKDKRSLNDHLKAMFETDSDFVKECATENYDKIPFDKWKSTKYMTKSGFAHLLSRSKGHVARYFGHQFFALFYPPSTDQEKAKASNIALEMKFDANEIKTALKEFVASDDDYPVLIQRVRPWITSDPRKALRILNDPQIISHKNAKKSHLTVNGLQIFCVLAKNNFAKRVQSLLIEIIKDFKSLDTDNKDAHPKRNLLPDAFPPFKKQKVTENVKKLQNQMVANEEKCQGSYRTRFLKHNFARQEPRPTSLNIICKKPDARKSFRMPTQQKNQLKKLIKILNTICQRAYSNQ